MIGKKALTMVEVMIVLAVLALVATLAYNHFGNVFKTSNLKGSVLDLYKDLNSISDAYDAYTANHQGDDPDFAYPEPNNTFVSEGLLSEWPIPDEDWRTSGTCSSTTSPGGPLGYEVRRSGNRGGTASLDAVVMLNCVREDMCLEWNERYTNLGRIIPAAVGGIEDAGGTICYGNQATPGVADFTVEMLLYLD